MLPVDIISAYIICGAGSLVGAAVMALARPPDAAARGALRLCSWAFVAIGVGVGQFIVGDASPDRITLLVAVQGTVLGSALFGWGFARLNGRHIERHHALLVLLVAACAVVLVSGSGPHVLNIGFCVMSLVVGVWIVVVQWNYVTHPRNLAERLMGWSLIAYTLSWAVRLAYSVSYDGPPLDDFFYAPPLVRSAFAIFYGVIPIIMASLVLNVVNARLAEQLASRALTDELTGVFTRRALYQFAPGFIAAAERSGEQVALLILDLDHFKRVNDSHGHLGGDEVLRHAADVLRAQLRAGELLTRFGGEEFVVLLRVSDLPVARAVAERLRGELARQPCGVAAGEVTVTASIGVSLLHGGESLDTALQRADQALYRAKDRGRNRVETCAVQAA